METDTSLSQTSMKTEDSLARGSRTSKYRDTLANIGGLSGNDMANIGGQYGNGVVNTDAPFGKAMLFAS